LWPGGLILKIYKGYKLAANYSNNGLGSSGVTPPPYAWVTAVAGA